MKFAKCLYAIKAKIPFVYLHRKNFAGRNAGCSTITIKARHVNSSQPYLLYSDGNGNIFEDTSLYAIGRSGWDAIPVAAEDWIELPEGGSLYELPLRRAIGLDVFTNEMRLCDKGWAVAAFIPPAHTGLYIAAYESEKDAPPSHCFVILLRDGWTAIFMCRQFE